MSNKIDQDDLVAAGFKRLDSTLIEQNPPKIKWGNKYNKMTDSQKIHYLERVASAMNHAAALIQSERDKLGKLCEQKEEQLIAREHAVLQNNQMLQQQITQMNSDRQNYNAEIKRLRTEVKVLETKLDN